MSTLHARVQQWARLEGERQSESELVVVRTTTAQVPNRRKGQCLVVVEAVDNAVRGRDACALVAQTLSDTFYTSRSGTITSSLRNAFKAAHQALCAYNEHMPESARTLVGASCVVIHDSILYLAQAQPTQALIMHHAHVHVVPDVNDPVAMLDGQHALGSPDFTVPAFMRAEVAAGDGLVLCSSNVIRQIPPEHLASLLQQRDAKVIANSLHDLAVATGLYEAHVLVVEWTTTPVVADAIDIDSSHAPPHAWRAPALPTQAARALAREQPLPRTTVADRRERVTKQRSNSTASERSVRSHATLADSKQRERHAAPKNLERTQRAQHISEPNSARVPRRETTNKRASTQRTVRRRAATRQPLMRWFSAVLLIGVIAAVGVGVQQIRQRDVRIANTALAQVEEALAAAESADTPADAQQQLATAETALHTEVAPLLQTGVITETKAEVWQHYQQVLGRYDQAMATINQVSFIDQLQPVASLPDGQGLVNRVVLGASGQAGAASQLFLLDRSGGRLLQAGQTDPVLQRGDDISGVAVNRLRDVLWSGDKILVFDRGDPATPAYRMLYRDGNQWVAVQLLRTDTMSPIDGDLPIATSDGHVFIWDREAKQVWRYTAGNLALPPVPMIADTGGIEIDRVVDIAVDGRTYLLTSDGSVVVIENGTVVQQFPAPQLAVPISSVVSFVVTPDTTAANGSPQPGAIYVLDTQNERVLQLDKNTGQLVQQIQARQHGTLNQLMDLAVDPSTRMLYLANGTHVLQTPLPLPPTRANSLPEPAE